jgi:hypothetical protein
MKSCLFAALFVLPICTGCSLGEGEGDVKSDQLRATDCWTGVYDLQPDFFAAVPSQDSVHIRAQRGTDIQEVSDGLAVLVEDLAKVHESWIDKPMVVTLSPGILPPGATFPSPPPEGQPAVHAALYMQSSCHNQNTVLYAIGGSVTFHSLFSGDLNEDNAAEKFTDAEFSLHVGDPRDAPVGMAADQIPAENQSLVTGFFRFYFERGQPGQPFP